MKLAFNGQHIENIIKKSGMPIVKYNPSEIPDVNTRNKEALNYWFDKWVVNAFANYSNINLNDSIQNHLLKKHDGKNAIVLGAGPSLDDNINKLKNIDRDKTIIFCSNSCLKNLVANDIKPDYVVTFDAHHFISHCFDDIDTVGMEMITHTSIHPNVLEAWKGRKYFFNTMHPKIEFFETILPMVYRSFPSLPNSACVVNTCVRIALYTGCKKIYLVGVDYGFPNMKYRATQYSKESGKWEPVIITEQQTLDKINSKYLYEKNGVKCWEEHIGYNQNLNFLAALKIIDKKCNEPLNYEIIDCSNGIINEFRKGDIKEL